MILHARRYDTGQAVRLDLSGGRIAALEETASPPGEKLPWAAPGLIDIQVNGYGGQEFSAASLTLEKTATIIDTLARAGATRVLPTVTTESRSVITHALTTIARCCAESPATARRVVGIHLEGPFITRQDGARGAHPLAHCHEPNWDEFQAYQAACGGQIRLVTLSAEYDEAPEFIRQAVDSGVIVALGHMATTPDQVRAAVDAGARLSTHLGNGCHQTLPRHPNYLWSQLADDRLTASLIVDGHHLPPEVVKCFLRIKSPQRCILVSDLSGQAGRAPGRYMGSLCEVEILETGKLVVAGQRAILAGATAHVAVGVANVMRFADVSLATAIDMATLHPARLLGIDPGKLEVGAPANLVLFDLVDSPDGQSTQFVVRQVITPDV